MPAILGCIADDFTGGTDLAGMLVKAGMRTIQMIGVPSAPLPDDVDAVVIALKSRTVPAPQAIEESLQALRYLQRSGCRQFYFKYCSTFDSTDAGNIGPVAEALMDALGTDFTIACPAFPENKRTIFKGYLFVGDELLSESGMRNHPLTPMTDPNLVRVLQRQSRRRVGLIDYATVAGGAEVITARIAALKREGVGMAIVDALSNEDLMKIGAALDGMPLVTAGSGIALGLPQNFRKAGLLKAETAADVLDAPQGLRAVISGSCSVATNAQVADFIAAGRPAFSIDPLKLAAGVDVVAEALAWAKPLLAEGPPLLYATAAPESVKAVQGTLGVERAGALVEEALAAIARGLVEMGVRQMLIAGGETSGAVVKALGVEGLRIGAQIDPGVPWTTTLGRGEPLALALKSGNFGSVDFFSKAWSVLQ
jgi:uncharacterized protein YgbK (DUF1537 family)